MSIYALKGRFQGVLRPFVVRLQRWGCTANGVTLLAAVVSLLVAMLVGWLGPQQRLMYLMLPVWMAVRMAFNAIDGMLAREFGQKSDVGAYLNELCDVVSDAALYLSLLTFPGSSLSALWLLVVFAMATEYAGVLGVMVGAERRYDGPMGKSDRAFVFGVLGGLLALRWIDVGWVNALMWMMTALCGVTIVRRVRNGLREVANNRPSAL